MKENKWKKLFFLLLGINAFILILLFVMINLPAKDEEYKAADINENGYVPFHIQTNKQDLNQVINHYLEKEGLTGAIDYKVLLSEEVDLYGSIPVFSKDIQMKLSFEPKALENGDVVLQQKSISVGQLQLPVSYILKFIRDRYKLPEGVIIQPKAEKIYVSLNEMKFKSDLKIRVNEFDLHNDDISFSLLVPVK